MIETTMSDAVLARLEALTARLDEQAAEIAHLKAEHARLNAGLATPAVAAPAPPASTSRRGMLRRVLGTSAAAALLLVAKEAATAEAAIRGNIAAGSVSTATYGILATTGDATDPASFIANVTGAATSHGVIGSLENPGIAPPFHSGVLGQSHVWYGVIGLSRDGEGVYGRSMSSVGVHGKSTNNAGLFGEGPIGVFALGSGTAAVYGTSNTSYGAWGNSGASSGLIGTSTTYIGVQALSTSHWGLHAKSPTYAGVFEGNVFVTGQVIALGGVVGASGTSAGARTAEASTLAEDVGEAALVNGKATVTLDQGFADAAGGDYRVFLTELADLGGLYVARKGPREFEVRSRGGAGQAAAHGRFDYRVVARATTAAGTRAAPLAPPDLTTVKPAPKPPEAPRAPEPSGTSDERRRP